MTAFKRYLRKGVTGVPMVGSRHIRRGAAWLELLLALAIILLLFQLFPSVPERILSGLDFRQWTRSTWFLLNAAILILLVVVRIGPTLVDQWKSRQTNKLPASAAAPVVVDRSEDVRVLMRRDEQLRAKLQRKLAFYFLLVPCLAIGMAVVVKSLKSSRDEATRAANTILQSNPGADFKDSQNGVIGVKFSVPSGRNVKVTHLGVYDKDGDGLQLNHRVGIFRKEADSAQAASLIAEATVPYGRHAPLEGNFRWVTLETPVSLSAGATYVLAAESFGEIDHERPAIVVGDGWPASFDEGALRRDGFERAWNPKIIGSSDTEPTTILRTDKAWPTCPDREDPVSNSAVHGPANLIIAEGE